MSKDRYALTFDEMTRARYFFHKHADEYITDEFQMRTILSEIGQYPPTREIQFVLDCFDGKLSFNNFCNYCSFLKKKYSKPEPRDVDTIRAFTALGGASDRSGDISTEDLRATCKAFQLTIDIDKMIHEVDEDGSGAIDYSEFANMWKAESEDEEEPTKPLRSPGTTQIVVPSGKDEPALEEEDNLQVVRSFLFPLTRKPTIAPGVAASKRKSLAGSTRQKSVFRLPPIGNRQPSQAPADGRLATQEDAGEQGESTAASEPAAAGLKPAPPPPKTARQSVSGFVVPNPVVLDLRGRGRGRRTWNTTPRKPGSEPPSARRPSPRTARV